MTSLLGVVASYVVNALWQLPLLAAAGWCATGILRRVGQQAQHRVWVGALLLSLLTPAASIPLAGWLTMPGSQSAGAATSSVRLLPLASQAARLSALPGAAIRLLALLYAASLLYFALRLLWSAMQSWSLIKTAESAQLNVEQTPLWLRCQRSFGLSDVRLGTSTKIAGPVTLGLRQPILLLPEGFLAACSPEDFLAAMAHECAHIQRRDFLKNLAYEVATLAIAFHPVTWLLKEQIAQTREMICDAMATETLIAPREYTRSLLRLASAIADPQRPHSPHAIGVFDANILEKRVMRMNLPTPRIGNAARYACSLAAILLLSSVAAVGAASAVTVDPNTAQIAGPIYKVGNGVTAPVVVSQKDPEFPKDKIKTTKAGFKGVTVVSLLVGANGVPRDVHVVNSLAPDFDAKAVESVRQYRFKPAMREGKPVTVSMNIEVDFQKF